MRFLNNPYTLLVLTNLFWAGNTIAGKLASGVIPPFTLTFLRWLLVCAIALVIAWPHLAAHRQTITQHALKLLTMGALGFSLFNTGLYTALNYTSALNVGIEQGTFPAVIVALMFIVYRERISLLQGLGVLLAMAGVTVTVAQGSLDRLLGLQFNIGDIIMMGGVLSFALYSIMLRTKPQLPWQVFFLMLAIGGLVASVPFFALDLINGRYPEADWRVGALLAYVIIFPSFVSQVLWIRGVEMIGAGRASLFINLIPVFATVLAVVILGETFETYHAIGLVGVLGGIAFAEWSGRRQSQKQAATAATAQ
ncbi:MAG: DMT family transporter [Devosiaceae bacterium]|nr:DMT family transporter [Devosiaceae bacterium MH13]